MCWPIRKKQIPPTKLTYDERFSFGGYRIEDPDVKCFAIENRENMVEMNRWAAREYVAAAPADFPTMLADFRVKAGAKLENEWFRWCTHPK